MTRLAIVGSRDYPRLDIVRTYVRLLKPGTVVISGGARGVDSVAENEARDRGLEVVVHVAEWRTRGRAAGPLRNSTIVIDCDQLVAFWDTKSRGTMDAMNRASRDRKLFRVFGPDGKRVTYP